MTPFGQQASSMVKHDFHLHDQMAQELTAREEVCRTPDRCRRRIRRREVSRCEMVDRKAL